MNKYFLNYIDELESEAIYIIREVVSEFENPTILFSGGKDSILLTHLARKAFYPSNIPFSFMHIDTGHNFSETLKFRDNLVKELKLNMVVGSVQKMIDNGEIQETKNSLSRNTLQIPTLLKCLETNKVDAALGGARRDEEKSRAKERVFSHRDEFGVWDPKNQRPEVWNVFNTYHNHGEHFRVFPISNWTEIDIWNYIKRENIKLPSLYFSHERNCIIKDGVILSYEGLNKRYNIKPQLMQVRFRTCGDIPITGAMMSNAKTVDEVIHELSIIKTTERGSRADDKTSDTAMEDRKSKGYF